MPQIFLRGWTLRLLEMYILGCLGKYLFIFLVISVIMQCVFYMWYKSHMFPPCTADKRAFKAEHPHVHAL